MKIYRVEYIPDGSDGFAFFSSKRKAEAAIHAYRSGQGEDGGDYRLDEFDFPISKEGMLQALRQLASHPDNG